MEFVNLDTITCYSTLHSTIKIPELVKVAKQRGYQALAISDINVMHGAIQFYDECIANNIKPIIGMTLRTKGLKGNNIKIVLLAKNQTGYQNLLQISTQINTTMLNHDLNSLLELFDGLVAIIHPLENEIMTGSFDDALLIIDKYKKIFTDLYMGYSPSTTTIKQLEIYEKLYKNGQIDIVYSPEVSYLNAEDALPLKVLRAIDCQEKLNPNDPLLTAPGSQDLKTTSEITSSSQGDIFQSISNSCQVAKKLNVKIYKEKITLPHFKPTVSESVAFLKELVFSGLRKIKKDKNLEYQKRANYELNIIEKMGFSDYFLIIWDIINFANSKDIQLGAGRGSAAGSLVSYTLGISKVDPIKFDLIFERFLNPERVNMPDIDLDVPDDRRLDIIKYLQQKYGSDNFAQIITFSTLGVKQGIRDCLRVFGSDNQTVNKWLNSIPRGFHVTLKESFKQSVKFKNLVNENNFGRMIFAILKKIEGLPRQASIHAAGVVISEEKLVSKLPLQSGVNNVFITQFVYHDVEEIGLLKIDILGLRNLSILKKMVDLIRRYDDSKFKIENVSLQDSKTLNIFRDGDTDGVFQFESSGLKRVLIDMEVESFNDIVAANALYRPGPMAQIRTYIDHKKGKKNFDQEFDSLKPITDSTYGVIIYQEQVMKVANIMAGFPLYEADILRRAMSKKNRELLDQYQNKFISGAIKNGYKEFQAKKIYDLIEYFSNYGFNKSHSVAYSMLAFWLAYIKAHYPLHFFAVQLDYSIGDFSRLRSLMNAVKKRNLDITGPSINTSFVNYTDDGQKILIGLSLIKGLRSDFLGEIVNKRIKYGKYRDLTDFLRRLNQRYLKFDNFIPLIQSGACDDLHPNRRELIENLKTNLDSLIFSQNNVSLFEQLKPRWDSYPDFSRDEKISMEYEMTGLYIHGTPFDKFSELAKIYYPKKIKDLANNQNSWVFVTIVKTKVIKDKNGKNMAFLTLDDSEDSIEGVIFSDKYLNLYREIEEGKKVSIYGCLREKKGMNFVVQKAFSLIEAKQKFEKNKLFIETSKMNNVELKRLKILIANYPGLSPVYLINNDKKQNILLSPNNWVDVNEEFYHRLLNLVGKQQIVYRK